MFIYKLVKCTFIWSYWSIWTNIWYSWYSSLKVNNLSIHPINNKFQQKVISHKSNPIKTKTRHELTHLQSELVHLLSLSSNAKVLHSYYMKKHKKKSRSNKLTVREQAFHLFLPLIHHILLFSILREIMTPMPIRFFSHPCLLLGRSVFSCWGGSRRSFKERGRRTMMVGSKRKLEGKGRIVMVGNRRRRLNERGRILMVGSRWRLDGRGRTRLVRCRRRQRVGRSHKPFSPLGPYY